MCSGPGHASKKDSEVVNDRTGDWTWPPGTGGSRASVVGSQGSWPPEGAGG